MPDFLEQTSGAFLLVTTSDFNNWFNNFNNIKQKTLYPKISDTPRFKRI